MNIFKRIYCRVFQTVFRIAIPVLPYTNPEVLKSCNDVPDLLLRRKINSVLIVTDEVINSSGLADKLKRALENNNIKYIVYDKTVPNPTVSNVEEARKLYIENSCKCLIGIGGGSSIDCAKAVGARIARPKKNINKMEGIIKIILPTPYTIGIPTTAGTGSEVTVTTVITDDTTHHKFPISDFPLIPNVCVHDAELTASLPRHLTATTGMDALTHAIEAYIGRSTTKSTRKDALEAVKLITENLYNAFENGNNMEARQNMLTASFLAGRAFSKSYVGYCHAVAHSLGGKYSIPHGLANAVLIPYTLEIYGKSVYKKCKNLAIAMGIATKDTDKKTATHLLIEKLKEMNSYMGIASKLKGIKEDDIDELAAYADKEANPIYPVPKLFDKNELKKFYYTVMEK